MRRPTPSFIVSCLALVVATGGTSYAAVQYGSEDVRNNSLTGVDVKNGSIGSVDIGDGTLRSRDFRKGALPRGPQGEQGPQGPRGEQGPAGAGRWLLVDATGAIVAQSGGFTVASAYDAPGTPAGAVGNVYIDANEDLSDNGIVATIALQNQVDQNGDTVMNGRALGADNNPEFSGEITGTMCGITGVVACAPAGTNNNEHFVVSPRLSDGSVTDSTNRKRFYVIISGDSSDLVAP